MDTDIGIMDADMSDSRLVHVRDTDMSEFMAPPDQTHTTLHRLTPR